MSNDSPTISPCLNAGQEAGPLDWLLSLLRKAIVGVMADDTPLLNKANALARLGNLYLKTYHTAELERTNAEPVERVAESEQRVTASGVGIDSGEEEAAAQPGTQKKGSAAASKPGKAKRPKSRSHDRRRPAERQRPKPSPPKKSGGAASG
jgi:hypothetical protein